MSVMSELDIEFQLYWKELGPGHWARWGVTRVDPDYILWRFTEAGESRFKLHTVTVDGFHDRHFDSLEAAVYAVMLEVDAG
jgi:hypothetical protein